MSHLPGADLEIRKHLWRGLARLTPAARVGYLRRLCRVCTLGGSPVRVTTHTGTLQEAFMDANMLVHSHGLTFERACVELEALLKKER